MPKPVPLPQGNMRGGFFVWQERSGKSDVMEPQQPVIVIKAVSPTQLAVACTFPTVEMALAALDAARRKIAAGEVPVKKPAGVELVRELPPTLRGPGT